MPYRYARSKSRKAVRKAASFNIKSLHHGPQYRKNVRKFGVAKANQMAIAAGFNIAKRGPKHRRRHK